MEIVIGEVPFHLTSNDAIAWEGVVVDPDGKVEQAISRKAPLQGASILEVGLSAMTYAIRHASEASQVYAAELGEKSRLRGNIPLGFPKNVNVLPLSSDGLPLKDGILDIAVLREPYAETKSDLFHSTLTEALRTLRAGGHCFVVCLNDLEGDLGSLIETMLGQVERAETHREWLGADFALETVETCWKAPGRTILRRVLAAEFADLPGIELADQIAVSELSCRFDLFWKTKS